jgi:sporulation protein YabP
MRENAEEKRAQPPKPHTLQLDNRQRAVITGVEDVDSFNEQMIVLLTSAGAMTLVGEQLHIARLNLDDGQLLIEGHVYALEYDDKGKSARGRIGKLFK